MTYGIITHLPLVATMGCHKWAEVQKFFVKENRDQSLYVLALQICELVLSPAVRLSII